MNLQELKTAIANFENTNNSIELLKKINVFTLMLIEQLETEENKRVNEKNIAVENKQDTIVKNITIPKTIVIKPLNRESQIKKEDVKPHQATEQKHVEESKSLNEKMEQHLKKEVHQVVGQHKNILNLIDINTKFILMSEVFFNNEADYTTCLEAINKQENMQNVLLWISQNILIPKKISEDNEGIKVLINLANTLFE